MKVSNRVIKCKPIKGEETGTQSDGHTESLLYNLKQLNQGYIGGNIHFVIFPIHLDFALEDIQHLSKLS